MIGASIFGVTQHEMDDAVARIRAVVAKYGKGHPALDRLSGYYSLLSARVEHCTFGLLIGELDDLEKESCQIPERG